MTKLYIKYNILLRCEARLGRALCLGRRNRRFKSCHIGCARINKYQESIYNPWQGHKGVSGGYMPDALFFILFWQILMFKIIQRVYCAGKFQMFYQKAAVWGRWCLSPVLNVSVKHLFCRNIGALCTIAYPIQVQTCCCW